MTDPVIKAREDLIAEREAEGRPLSDVAQRGIRSGQWDNGDLIRRHVKNNIENPLRGDKIVVQ